MAKKVAELEVLMQHAWGVHLSIRLARQHGTDPVWASRILFEWSSVTKQIARKRGDCVSFVQFAVIRPDRWAFADPVLKFGKALWLYSGQLKIADHGVAAEKISDQTFQLFRLAAEWAIEAGDAQRLGDIAIAARAMNEDPDSDSHRWARAVVARIRPPDIRKAVDDAFERVARREAGELLDYDIRASEAQIYQNLATAAGIDLSDLTDPEAAEVLTAIRDLNPGRVLKECEHIFITLGPSSVIGRRLHLPTAAPKIMYCTKHRYGLSGLGSLDDAYAAFKREFCSKCPDAAPRPDNWVYSNEWQQAENKRHAEFGSV